MTHRTYGRTYDCRGCRFWSEMLARSRGLGPVEAMCLAETGPKLSQYTIGTDTCPAWESGEDGAVDEPEAP